MRNTVYGPLEPEPDIEWAEQLERTAFRALAMADFLAEQALDESNTPVVRRMSIWASKRWLKHFEDLLATAQRKPSQAP